MTQMTLWVTPRYFDLCRRIIYNQSNHVVCKKNNCNLLQDTAELSTINAILSNLIVYFINCSMLSNFEWRYVVIETIKHKSVNENIRNDGIHVKLLWVVIGEWSTVGYRQGDSRLIRCFKCIDYHAKFSPLNVRTNRDKSLPTKYYNIEYSMCNFVLQHCQVTTMRRL